MARDDGVDLPQVRDRDRVAEAAVALDETGVGQIVGERLRVVHRHARRQFVAHRRLAVQVLLERFQRLRAERRAPEERQAVDVERRLSMRVSRDDQGRFHDAQNRVALAKERIVLMEPPDLQLDDLIEETRVQLCRRFGSAAAEERDVEITVPELVDDA